MEVKIQQYKARVTKHIYNLEKQLVEKENEINELKKINKELETKIEFYKSLPRYTSGYGGRENY